MVSAVNSLKVRRVVALLSRYLFGGFPRFDCNWEQRDRQSMQYIPCSMIEPSVAFIHGRAG
jgi:hypothetical protein